MNKFTDYILQTIGRGPQTVVKTCALMHLCTYVLVPLCTVLLYTGTVFSQGYPQRIVSLGPSVTKGLYLLGVEDRLIANTMYCVDPPQAKNKEKIGTVAEANIEKILNLKPDLVLAISLTNPKTKEKLKSLGINVVTLVTPKNFNEICEQFLELGKLVGKEKEAKKIVDTAKNRVNNIKRKIKKIGTSKVVIQVGAKPLFVATGGYFVNDYIELSGGTNIAKDAKEGIYSREEVLKANPDVIIITTMGMLGEEEKKVWGKYKTINAVKNNRVYVINTDKITSPTPISFVDTLEEFVRILHEK